MTAREMATAHRVEEASLVWATTFASGRYEFVIKTDFGLNFSLGQGGRPLVLLSPCCAYRVMFCNDDSSLSGYDEAYMTCIQCRQYTSLPSHLYKGKPLPQETVEQACEALLGPLDGLLVAQEVTTVVDELSSLPSVDRRPLLFRSNAWLFQRKHLRRLRHRAL